MVLPTVSRCGNDQSDKSGSSSKSERPLNKKNPDKKDEKQVNHLLNSESELKRAINKDINCQLTNP